MESKTPTAKASRSEVSKKKWDGLRLVLNPFMHQTPVGQQEFFRGLFLTKLGSTNTKKSKSHYLVEPFIFNLFLKM